MGGHGQRGIESGWVKEAATGSGLATISVTGAPVSPVRAKGEAHYLLTTQPRQTWRRMLRKCMKNRNRNSLASRVTCSSVAEVSLYQCT